MGEGPEDWLLLRGLGRSAAHFAAFPEQWRTQVCEENACVYVLDNPGVGEDRRSSPCTVQEIADDVWSRVQALRARDGRTGPLNCLGVSLGGMLALELASRPGESPGP